MRSNSKLWSIYSILLFIFAFVKLSYPGSSFFPWMLLFIIFGLIGIIGISLRIYKNYSSEHVGKETLYEIISLIIYLIVFIVVLVHVY